MNVNMMSFVGTGTYLIAVSCLVEIWKLRKYKTKQQIF